MPSSVPEFDDVIPADLEAEEWIRPDEVRELRDTLPPRLDAALGRLHGDLRAGSERSPIVLGRELLEAMRGLDEAAWRRLRDQAFAAICSAYAEVWRAFAMQFSPLLVDPSMPGADFPRALDQLGGVAVLMVVLVRRS